MTDAKEDTPPGRALGRMGPGHSGGLTGPIKAALWLLSTDEELAVETLKFLEPAEVEKLAQTTKKLGRTTPAELAQIHQEFQAILRQEPLHLRGSGEYLGKLAGQAFGAGKAKTLLGPAEPEPVDTSSLGQADVEILVSVLKLEHPQIMAAVLAKLAPARSAEILSHLPEQLRRDVVTRVARLSRVPSEVLEKAEGLLSAGLPTTSMSDSAVDGIKVAADVLNQLDADSAQEILEGIDETSDGVADRIRQAMFTFEDLTNLDRKGFQVLLKEVPSDQLVVAIKTASEELKEKVFDSLSKRAAEMLREDLEIMGPVRLQAVQEAQQIVVSEAIRLRDEGRITIAAQGEDFV